MATLEDNNRLFEPKNSWYGPPSLMKYYPASGLTFVKSQIKDSPSTAIIVGVDGACPDNGNSPTRGSWGIYFGRNSQYNTCGRLPETERKTNNVAEIYAAISTVKLISQRVHLGPREIKELVIMSDSAWLVNSMTDWIGTWKQNGFQSTKNEFVINSELIHELDDLIEEVETTLGLEVKFWHVKRKWNAGADRLANIAFENDADWERFWKSQLDGEPKSATVDLLSFSASAVDTMGPRLLCTEYPLIGKGEWLSSLRAFLIIQTSWKVSCLPGRTPGFKNSLRDQLLAAMLGPNWRKRANLELEKYKSKIATQTALLLNATKKFHEGGDERKRKFAVRAEVNNHRIMTIVSHSLPVPVPFAEQNEHYESLAKQYLGDNTRSNTSNNSPILVLEKEANPTLNARKARKATKFPKPEEPASGVRLDWDEDWVAVDYP